ncbi:MAG: hypothetical protein ACE5GB_14800 [Acidimicrobiales bacterium]
MGLVVSGCGRGAGSGHEDEASFTAAMSCEGLADRWVTIQQAFLDDLGDASQADLDPATPGVTRALTRVGSALTEQARDTRAAGCEAELAIGGTSLCRRVGRLEAGGGAAHLVLEGLRAGCAGA